MTDLALKQNEDHKEDEIVEQELASEQFSDNVLQKIKEEKLAPKPRWHFLLKNYVIWILGGLSLILGAVAISLVFYMLSGMPGPDHGADHPLGAWLFFIPFFWLICLTIFGLSVYYYIKHTKTGYRYSAGVIIAVTFIASLFLGALLNLIGTSRMIDDVLGENVPLYDRVINPQLHYWSAPESGRLTGVVVSPADTGAYYLMDRAGKAWVIILVNESDSSKVEIGRPVRLTGRMIGDNGFLVNKVSVVDPGRGFFKRPLPPRDPDCRSGYNNAASDCRLRFLENDR